MLGHEQRCEEIHRGGGAEQYHAEKKYKEAVAVAVAKCADTKGQTCYICLEAVHARTGEGLVRMCACRGASGFAHVACLAVNGEEHEETLREASSYSETLIHEKRYQEVKSLLRTSIPVARRVLGEDNATTLRMRWNYASALCEDDAATLDDLREAVTTLEDTARTVRRVFGASHPLTRGFWIEITLGAAREVLAARETRLRNFASFLRPNGHEYL